MRQNARGEYEQLPPLSEKLSAADVPECTCKSERVKWNFNYLNKVEKKVTEVEYSHYDQFLLCANIFKSHLLHML